MGNYLRGALLGVVDGKEPLEVGRSVGRNLVEHNGERLTVGEVGAQVGDAVVGIDGGLARH